MVCPLGDISDIAKDVEARFDTSNYELNRPLAKKKRTKNKLVYGKINYVEK